MKVQDRGTMKWVSLMLPEHTELLKEVFAEEEMQPILDNQKMSEIDLLLKEALYYQRIIEITYYEDGAYYQTVGRLAKIDQWRGYIMLLNDHGEKVWLRNVTDVEAV